VVNRFLVTTALEQTWPTENEPVLFLGEWCRLYSRKERWSKMDAEVTAYHWDNRRQLYSDYKYLQELYEQLLSELASQLNEIHNVSHSLRYWRILVGVWLGYFTQVMFDRWTCIKKSTSGAETLTTIISSSDQVGLVPNDMKDFNRLFHDEEWNHHIYSVILKKYTNVLIVEKQSSRENIPLIFSSSKTRRPNLGGLLKKSILSTYTKIASAFVLSNDAFFAATYLGLRDEMLLQFKLKQIPQIYFAIKMAPHVVDSSLRSWLLDGKSGSEFEVFVRYMIPKQIPVLYLEGYEALTKQADRQCWPKQPKLIFTSNAFSSDEVFKVACAKMTERGVPLVIGQHGGHYGAGLWSFPEDHELSISDYYLSWGWDDPKHKHIRPVAKLKLHTQRARDKNPPHRVTLVTATLQRYSGTMMSSFMSSQYLKYLQDMFAFVKQLPENMRQSLTVRLYPQDEGWSQVERWRENFIDIELDSGQSDFFTLMQESKIFICTYNATTFLESFSLDVPTIVFWNPHHWELRESAIPYFDELKSVGVFHESPVTAALHCAAIWDDVEAWWQSVAVKSAIKNFCNRYARHPVNKLDGIEAVFREIQFQEVNT
jgi:putative transferase (TIGR04331 family)